MFRNIGGKIKGLAELITWLGIIGSVICGIILINQGSGYYGSSALATAGVVVIVVGSLTSWISSFILYGFGELIEQTTWIAENTAGR